MSSRRIIPPAGAEVVGDGSTIVAIATAMGRGALATVRASGPGVRTLMRVLLESPPTIVRRATRCVVRDVSGAAIDEVVVTLYAAPHSFTGEDLLELSTHGGLMAPTAVLAAAIRAGARQAEPGEFTRRAVLNGKLDLLQAEAIGDLIDARSSAAHRLALRQLDGGLTRRVSLLRDRILELEALLAYDIDFPEEDDGPMPRARIADTADTLFDALGMLLATTEQGTLVHHGALVVLAGAPNVGKSSLFNALGLAPASRGYSRIARVRRRGGAAGDRSLEPLPRASCAGAGVRRQCAVRRRCGGDGRRTHNGAGSHRGHQG